MVPLNSHLEGVTWKILFLWLGVLGILCVLPLLASRYYVYYFTELIIWGVFSLSYNLLLGHGGMLSLGHAAFFGIGAYTYALLTKKAALQFLIALTAAPVAGLLASAMIGFLCVRGRIKGVYFSFLTLAFGQVIYLIIFRWYGLTGSEEGIIGVPVPQWLGNLTNMYYFVLGVAVLCLFALLIITNSPFGTVLHAVRDNQERIRFCGLEVARFQLGSFSIGGFFAAVAGTLYVLLTKTAFTEYVGLETCVIPLFACLLGGMHTYYGPLVGAALIVSLDKLLGSYTEHWSAITGISVIVIVIAFPMGILGFLKQKTRRKSHLNL